ncbi:MAG: hypothetical protein KDD40_10575, partial [Bdellovibrionales bacterium]|nr:hypothetical protein [Bdellovibrionales bacterium]
LKCGGTLELSHDTPVNLRLRYYQGPRYSVALTLLIRKVIPGASNIHCNESSDYQYFYGNRDDKFTGLPPNLTDYWFGDLISAGWVVPTADNYVRPQE